MSEAARGSAYELRHSGGRPSRTPRRRLKRWVSSRLVGALACLLSAYRLPARKIGYDTTTFLRFARAFVPASTPNRAEVIICAQSIIARSLQLVPDHTIPAMIK